MFVFLCLTYFTKHNALQIGPYCCKWQNFTLFNGRAVFHCVYMCIYVYALYLYATSSLSIYIYMLHLLYPFSCGWALSFVQM